ncbi:MAG: helix-hairpin-helix domain-containing protein [Anaerolineae bacterium]
MRDRVEAEVREEVLPRLQSQLRVRFRLYVVGIALVSLLVGGLIGRYGFALPTSQAAQPGTPGTLPAAGANPAVSTEAITAGPQGTATALPDHLRVYVSGAVEDQQVVTVPVGSLVSDALDAAGGATVDADLGALNLAAPLEDHQHVVVPTRVSSPETGASPRTGLINVNSASSEELQALPGIGAKRAADIIDYREAHGPFETIEDIQAVPGIGPAILERIAPLITVEP